MRRPIANPHTAISVSSTKIAITAATSRSCPAWSASLLGVALLERRHRRDRHHRVVRSQAHHGHALGLPADPRDGSNPRAQNHAARADDQNLLLRIADHAHRGQLADPIRHLEREHTLACAMVALPTTVSPLPSLMPITPCVSRPIARTSFSLNRIALPRAVAMMMSSEPVVGVTQLSSSPSWRLIAINPLRRTFAYSASAVFFIYPFLVTISM